VERVRALTSLKNAEEPRIYIQHSKHFSHASCIMRHSRVQRWPHTSLLHFTSLHSLHPEFRSKNEILKSNILFSFSIFGLEILAVPWSSDWVETYASFFIFDCIFTYHTYIRIHFLHFTFTFTCHLVTYLFSFRCSLLSSFKTYIHITHHTSHITQNHLF
jgi:hypothetical protein